MHIGRALLLTLCSALAYGWCFPAAGLYGLAWFALVPFLVALRRSQTGVALFLAWIFSAGVAFSTSSWLPHAVASYYGRSQALGAIGLVGISTLMVAPYLIAFAQAYRSLAPEFTVALPLFTAAAWSAAELARATMLTGCPWALFGYSQAPLLEVVQIADITGVYGVSFVLVAVNAALAELWLQRKQSSLRAWAGLASATIAAVAIIGYGVVRLRQTPSTEGNPITIAMVQANIDATAQWRSDQYGSNLEEYMQLTHDAISASHASVIFWPENALTFFLDEEPLYRRALGHLLQPSATQLIAGGPLALPDSGIQPRYFSSVFQITPAGEIAAHYDKQHLLPFAEYFPLSTVGLLRRSFGRIREFTRGTASAPLPTLAGRAGILLCNEAMHADLAAARVNDGAEYLVNPSNDSWISAPGFSEQAVNIAILRAIEQRRYVVRASTAGPSVIVDSFGNVRQRTPAATRTWLAGDIRRSSVITPYCRLGDLFALLCLTTVAIALLIGIRRSPSDGLCEAQ